MFMKVTARRPSRKPLLFGLVALLLSSGVFLGWWQFSPQRKNTDVSPGARTLSLWLEGDEASGFQKEITQFLKTKGVTVTLTKNVAHAAITLSLSQSNNQKSWPITRAQGTPAKLEGETIIQKHDAPFLYLASTKLPPSTSAALAAYLTQQSAQHTPEWSLTTLGDIIIGRTVYSKVRKFNDPNKPFALFSQSVSSTDLTLANAENSFATRPSYPVEGMSFIAPPAFAAGLSAAGIDAVNVANNHSYNAGEAGFKETLDTYDNLKLGYFGGGRNIEASRKPLIKEVKSVKIALLGYSSIPGSQPATATVAGQNMIKMAPWGVLQESELAQMSQDIAEAKKQAKTVIVYYHWGQEYTHAANNDQRTVAHRAIDAGADLVIGTHPHWVQGVEWYKDKFIAYSLGNFIFDQEWSSETKQGTYLQMTFAGSNVTSLKLVPYQIEDYYQPRPVDAALSHKILQDVYSHSWWSK